MIINHNMSSLYTDRVLNISNDSIMKNMEKLSSGERINRAGDDASGLAVSEKMRSQIPDLTRLVRTSLMLFLSFRQQKVILVKQQTFFSVFANLQFSQQTVSTAMKIVCRFRLKYHSS